MDESRYAVILLDLGGVLWDIGGGESFLRRLGSRLSRAEELDFWSRSGWLERLDVASCTLHEFATSLITELQLSAKPERVLAELAKVDRGLFPGAMELLDALRGRYLRACLSNNNELHWERLQATGIEGGFERCYLSHEIGLRKPDPRVFHHVVEDLGVAAERILFLDDRAEHVAAAAALGLDAHRAVGVAGVTEVLVSRNVLPPPTPSP